MSLFKIRNFQQEDIPALMRLQESYAYQHQGVKVIASEVYASPAFHGGKDVFCLFHPNGQLLAYAAILPQFSSSANGQSHVIWAEIKADPILADSATIKDQLFTCLRRRIQELSEQQPALPLELRFQYLPHEESAIHYVSNKGAYTTMSIYQMSRPLNLSIPLIESPQGIEIRSWKMESTAEQAMYVQARNECFPEAPIRLDAWIYFMQSTEWALGTQIAAFDGRQLAGSLTVYWNEVVDPEIGYSEDIFVRPDWRRRKIAPAMIAAGLRYLQEHGLRAARLEVRATNRNALSLYESLGYRLEEESNVYTISTASSFENSLFGDDF